MSFHPAMPYGTTQWHRSQRITLPEGPEFAFGGSTGQTIVPFMRRRESVTERRVEQNITVAPVYNVDARGATVDLIKALPEILWRNNEAIEFHIIDGMQRGRYRL